MLFSLIVPIYKTEPYLRQCVDSVLSQTCSDYELILVDDGSPDACGAICDEYAAAHANIKVVHKANGGLAAARKSGMLVAEGDYVINLDSDDWVEPDYLEKASAILKEYHPDIITFAIRYCNGERITTDPEILPCGFYDRKQIEATILPNILLNSAMTHLHYYAWAKVLRRDLAYDKQLAVDERVSMGEDVSMTIPCYLEAQSVYISDAAMCNCRCHDDSMSRKFNPKQFTDIEIGTAFLRKLDAPDSFAEQIDRYCSFMCFVILAVAAKSGAKEQLPTVEGLWCDEFSRSFQAAKFDRITPKSKIAYSLLKKGKIKTAYHFLRLCAKLTGETT